jgi:hypothetical protein
MKRFLIIGFGAAIVAVLGCSSEASAYDGVILKADLYDVPAPVLEAAKYADVYSAPLTAEILSPSFTSNFNRLVVFPELGSSALLEGYESRSRGPPGKGYNVRANRSERNYHLTDALRFSLQVRTRLA